MPLSAKQAVAQAQDLKNLLDDDMERLDKIRSYVRDDPYSQPRWIPSGAPVEVRELAHVARVNMLKFVVQARTQSLYVEGFRVPRAARDVPAWSIWRRNQMMSRQIGIHRGSLTYGVSYAVVLPGRPVPVMRGVSPRDMVVTYTDDDDMWPTFALQKRRGGHWRLFDDTSVYVLRSSDRESDALEFVESFRHDVTFDGEPVTPVIRFQETSDLDAQANGIVEPHIPLQDQINITSFGLHVAQHYGAFRQRYIIGWLADTEEQKLKASASKLWTFADHPDDVKLGEFDQTNLDGYIASREATLRHLSTVSQTPAHELLGQLVNMSAAALAAANEGYRRAVTENQTALGEAHEQALNLITEISGNDSDPQAYVRWRDTEAHEFGTVVDGLGKLAKMLGVPVQELWEMVPDVSQDQVQRWKAAAERGDSMTQLRAIIDRQMSQDGQTENGDDRQST